MPSTTGNAIAIAARLRCAVERAAVALASVRLDGLLSAGDDLEEALVTVPALDVLREDQRQALRAEIDATRTALRRCRRLGASFTDLVGVVLDGQGQAIGYGLSADAAAALSGRSFTTRV